jgi:hypothetical protein
LFTFQVGPDRKEVMVHSSALAELSPSLNTLINGEMVEARSKCIDWADVDMDTFFRLCQFAYSGDYTTPQRSLSDRNSPTRKRSTPTQKPMFASEKKKKKKKKKKRNKPGVEISSQAIH